MDDILVGLQNSLARLIDSKYLFLINLNNLNNLIIMALLA